MAENKELLESLILELRRGTLILTVLSQLYTQEYGYSLIQKIAGKGMSIDAGTLYPLLRRLEKQGLLDSSWDIYENRPRRYYKLNPQGEALLQQLTMEWNQLNQIISQCLIREEE
jgi:DNA-binding PadR family transcriptional regulator